MFRVNNKDTVFSTFAVNFENISRLFLVFLLLALNREMFAEEIFI